MPMHSITCKDHILYISCEDKLSIRKKKSGSIFLGFQYGAWLLNHYVCGWFRNKKKVFLHEYPDIERFIVTF